MLLLYNAKIHSSIQCTAIAVRGDRIVALGSDAEIRRLADSGDEQIDLKGALVLPGLTDSHLHFEWFSIGLSFVDVETDTLDEALRRVAERATITPKGQWIRGHGWNYTRWGDEFPTARQLDSVAPNHPIYLTAKSMHMAWCNSLALQLAGVTAETQDPPGGALTRDANGNPTGTLAETAMDLMTARSYTAPDKQTKAAIPQHTVDDVAKAMIDGQKAAWKVGLTGVHDFDGVRSFKAWQILRERGEQGLRVVKTIPVAYLDHAIALGLRSGFGDHWIRIGNVKIFADGALGPRTAAMIEPYESEPNNYGIVVTDKEEIYERGSLAASNGLALTVHAIGDKANHDLLDVYETLRSEEAIRNTGYGTRKLRHRAEHLQVVHPDDLGRFAQLGIIGSAQPIHATSDMLMVDKYWGKRGAGAYAWRTQLNHGTLLTFGSDTPVEPINPFWGIHAAVTRRRGDGSPGLEGWYPEQRLTIAEAIDGYTKAPAYVGYNEADLGTIEAGKLADLTIVDRDLFTYSPIDIRDTVVLGTMVGGEFKYRTL
ncbi:MAG TPA: amidohydrolase [Anaerolineales bacterium]|nr:amidohydrolase [Anaerolineales bacterium]